MKKSILTPFLLICSFFTLGALAQIQGPSLESELDIEFPGLHDREALVEIEFTVNSEGHAENFQAVAGFYEQRFVDAAVEALESATFTPAIEKGEPVDWSGYRITARYVIEDLFNTIQPGFSTAMREIEDLVNDQDYAKAEEKAVDLLNNGTNYFYEFAYVNTRLSEIYLIQNKLQNAAAATRWATMAYLPGEHRNYGHQSAKLTDSFNIISVNQFIDADIYSTIDVNTSLVLNEQNTTPPVIKRPPHLRSGLRYSTQGSDLGDKPTMNVLNLYLMQDALQAGVQIYARLGHIQAMKNDLERYRTVNSRVPEFLEEIDSLVDNSVGNGAPIQSRHHVEHSDAVFYPRHRVFTVANVEGFLSDIDIQCAERTVRLNFEAGLEWRIPASWGACSLRFIGTQGTEFSVIEFSTSS